MAWKKEQGTSMVTAQAAKWHSSTTGEPPWFVLRGYGGRGGEGRAGGWCGAGWDGEVG